MRLAIALLLLFAAMSISPVRADDCSDLLTQSAQNSCAFQAFEKSDADLNKASAQITDRLQDEPATAHSFSTAEKAWLAFREAECAFATSTAADGSLYPTLVAQCRERLTIKRAEELKAYLNCKDDMSCPF